MKSLKIFLLLYILLLLFASLMNSSALWGANHLMYLPDWFAWTIVGLSLILILFPVRHSESVDKPIDRLSINRSNITAVFAIVGVVTLLILLRTENHLLGDSYQRLSMVAGETPFSTTEYLDLLAHRAAYLMLDDPYLAYLIPSLISGLIFLVAVVFYSRRLSSDPVGFLAIFVLFLGLAQIQFFAGYAESYVISTALVALFLLLGWRAVSDGKNVWVSVTAFLAASAFHISAAFLAPGLIYLLWHQGKANGRAVYRVAAVVMAILFVATASYFIHLYGIGEIFTPIVRTRINPYTLLSVQHLTDLGNILLLVAPLPLALAIILAVKQRSGIVSYFKTPGVLFLLICSVCSLFFTLTIDPKLGALRDWDILSFYGVPFAFLAAQMVHDMITDKRDHTVLLLAGLAVILAHTLPWLYSNSGKEMAVATIKEVVRNDIHYAPEYYEGERLLSWGKIMEEQYGDTEELMRSYGLRVKGKPDDQRSWLVYGTRSYELGRHNDARRAVSQIRDLTKLEDYQLEDLVRLNLHFGYIQDAKSVLKFYAVRYPPSFEYLYLSGLTCKMGKNFQSAAEYYERAFQLQPGNIDLLLSYATVKANLGDLENAEKLLSRAAQLPELTAKDKADIAYLQKEFERAKKQSESTKQR